MTGSVEYTLSAFRRAGFLEVGRMMQLRSNLPPVEARAVFDEVFEDVNEHMHALGSAEEIGDSQ